MRYGSLIQQYFRQDKYIGRFSETETVALGFAGEPGRTNVIEFALQYDGVGLITDAKFMAFGCGYTLAVCSKLAETVIGRNMATLNELQAKDLIQFFDLPKHKRHAALLAMEALEKALMAWQEHGEVKR